MDVLGNATYITGTSVTVTVSATKAGFTGIDVTRPIAVDLIAPSVNFEWEDGPPTSLLVFANPFLAPTGDSFSDRRDYMYSASNLPSGLTVDRNGIYGQLDTPNAEQVIVTVTVTDPAGNPTDSADHLPAGGKARPEPDVLLVHPGHGEPR